MGGQQDWFSEKDRGYGIVLQVRRRLHEERSPWQHIEVFETETFGHLLTLDGLTMLTARDNFIYHEMMTHPALFTHADPRRVAVIGGGDCGSLREVLRHDGVVEVTLAELDERVTRVCEQYFPELCEANGDPRARFHFGDGIAWVAEREAGSLDVLVLDTTDPVGQAARLFGEPFYRDCRAALGDGGVLIAQSESPMLDLELIGSMRANLRAAGFDDVRTLLFPLPTYPSGWWSATMACKGGPLPAFRAADAATRTFATRYYNERVHEASLALPGFMSDAFAGES